MIAVFLNFRFVLLWFACFLSIPQINLQMAIFHGSSEKNGNEKEKAASLCSYECFNESKNSLSDLMLTVVDFYCILGVRFTFLVGVGRNEKW